jgi:lysophospholipase L1-like esterase
MAEPAYIARTGWTTGNLLAAIEAQKPATDFDIVTLLIGVNNQYQGRDTGEYRTEFTQCIQQAVKHARGRKDRVFVVSIPDYSVTPFGQRNNPEQTSRQIDAFNAINARITAEFGISYTNITTGSREALQNPALVAADGLHPSALEYKKWAEKLFEVVIKRI